MSLKENLAAVVLDAYEFDLHKRIIAKRDKAFAHSDSVAHEFEGHDYSGRIVMFYKPATDPLTRKETQALSRMIKKWIEHVDKLRRESKDD